MSADHAESSFRKLPTQVFWITGGPPPCPGCGRPLTPPAGGGGVGATVPMPTDMRCLHCNPLPDPPKS